MSVCVGRQPILDRSRRTCGYELLYRDGPVGSGGAVDGDGKTLRVIDASFFVVGIEALTGGRQAFVNFTRETLVHGYAASLPRDRLVVEILEDVAPDEDVLRACRALKTARYRLALDDVVTPGVPGAFLDLADIVKVDFRQTDVAGRRRIAQAFRPRGIRMLAEKVESEPEVEQAVADGYELFQGYFFARPTVVSGREVPAVKQNILRLLDEAHRPDPDHQKIEGIIRQDVGLALKLLVHMRAAAWGQARPVESVRRALLLLGDRGLRKWAAIVAAATLGHDRPPELLVTSLVRAAFCEGVLAELHRDDVAEEGFLMGLFSTIDAFLGQPLPEALERLPIPDLTRAALLGADNVLRPVLELTLAYERGEWDDVARLAAVLGTPDDALARRYAAAVEQAAVVS